MFSVVIPLYNKSYGIARAIESVLNQSLKVDFEIIIINDGSTDDSLLKVNKYINESNISVINQKNSGVSIARNVGIKKSKYDYICFLDADDWWEDNYFFTLNEMILSFPNEVFFLMGFQKNLPKDIKPIVLAKNIKIFKSFGKYFFNTKALVTPSICVKKNILFEAGLFPEGISLSEDLYLWSRIISKYCVIYSPVIVSNISYEEDNSRGNRNLKIPYVLSYYAENRELAKNINGFLYYVYLAHLYQSYKLYDYSSWKKRWSVGLKIFPCFSLLCLFTGFLLLVKKGFYNARSK